VLVLFKELKHQLVGWQVALLGDLAEDRTVFFVIEVIHFSLTNLPRAEIAEAVWLVDLEIETNEWSGHIKKEGLGRERQCDWSDFSRRGAAECGVLPQSAVLPEELL